jgi:DNA-binding NtrC family response regulator
LERLSNHLVRAAPLVVAPAHDLDEVFINHLFLNGMTFATQEPEMKKKTERLQAAAHPSVLVIASNERSALQSILQKAECRTFVCARYRDALDLIEFASVVICEDSLPDGSWLDVLRGVQELRRSPALIVTSRLADNRLWAEVLNLGGHDVLAQPLRAQEVVLAVQSAHRQWRNGAQAHTCQRPALTGKEV